MPITSTWNGATYAGNGSTTSFNYGQPLQSIYDLNVFLTDNNGINYPALISGVDYQIYGIGGPSSGWNLTYPLNSALAALPTGWSITVQLAIPLVTNSNITTINTNSGTAMQLAIDRLTMQDLSQQLQITNNAALVAGGGVLSVNGNIGNVVVTTANTQAAGNNSTLLATTAFMQNPLYCTASISGNQSISTATNTKVQFNTLGNGKTAWFDNTTNYRFQPLIAGKYKIRGIITFYFSTSFGSVSNASAIIYKNGSAVCTNNQQPTYITGYPYVTITSDQIIAFNGSTDYVEIWAFQATGATENIFAGSYFEATFVSAS